MLSEAFIRLSFNYFFPLKLPTPDPVKDVQQQQNWPLNDAGLGTGIQSVSIALIELGHKYHFFFSNLNNSKNEHTSWRNLLLCR